MKKIALLWAVLNTSSAFAACPAVPLAWPLVPNTLEFCHAAYGGIEDTQRREPAAVEYVLTAEHATHGCLPRTGLQFHVDPLLPAAVQGRPSDYANSGYDLGHLANNEDFAWDETTQRDTFSMLNVTPQLGTLNRQGWESGEDWTRAAAYSMGSVIVITGPIYDAQPLTMKADRLPVPDAFFKVLISGEKVFSFTMQNVTTPKTHNMDQYRVPITTINQKLEWKLPIPDGADDTSPWPNIDITKWRAAHLAACGGK